jgi:DNA-binding response OmpR family regulator
VGLRSVTIERPDQLLETLAAERPGVLLMDVQLPGTDGFVLTRQLRANPEWSELPIVLFSGSADQQSRDAAAGAGADGFLAKPIAAAELQSQLLARIEQVRQQRIAAGVSPATGLAEHERGVADAEKLFGAMRRDGGALSAAVVRLSDPADDAAWRRSCSRIARELKAVGAEVAHYDDTALVATVRGGYGLLANALATLRARGGQPDWVVGVAEAGTVGAPHVHELWLAAADAAASARASGEQFHAWTVEDSTRAPDVMIVEDDQSLAELIEFALLREGYTFKVFRTGPEALEALRTLKVGSLKPLILLDLDLPGLDGHAIHERLRVERPRDYVVVFLSVHSGDSDQVRALRAGAADYLTKPVSLRVLMSKLPRWVRQPRTQR